MDHLVPSPVRILVTQLLTVRTHVHDVEPGVFAQLLTTWGYPSLGGGRLGRTRDRRLALPVVFVLICEAIVFENDVDQKGLM